MDFSFSLSDIWDYILDGFDYFIHFDWFFDLKDLIVDMFTGLSEFSKVGLAFGVLGVLFLLFTKQWMLDSFLAYMKPAQKVITSILTYVGTFVACYILGNRFENS